MAAQLEHIRVKFRSPSGGTTSGVGIAAGEIALRGLILGLALGMIVIGHDAQTGLLAAAILALGATVVGWRS
ncbi:MAG TPA: hypothetical protein VFJ71_09605 [Candidatus Limnocylindrales bacterium]|nr:hypothetical protein [Candidatus Limnocylindrales bacterium]